MSDCKGGKRLLATMIATEVPEDVRREAADHARTCPSCRELLGLHDYLKELEMHEPDEKELSEIRRGVLRILRSTETAALPSRQNRWIGNWRPETLAGFLIRPALSFLLVALLVGAGYAAGRWTSANQAAVSESEPTSIMDQIEYAAAANQRAADGANSPFIYSNVRLRETDPATVRLTFDVATHLDLVRAKNDPLVAEILVQSILRRESLGTQLAAIDVADRPAPAVRAALVTSMLEDESLAVRLKAISKLTAESGARDGGDSIQEALLEVLRREESVQLRLLAIDYLTRQRVSPDVLRGALSAGRPEPGNAVYAKADEYLRTF